ncbi:hypothetical protein GGI12_000148 [Dipsacomyces acuminosporus]|nr:hypothetical protein GGI12_000148 [Dipsacomyces acuminosporus]
MIIGASNESLPAMFEVKERSGGRTLSIFMGLPDAKLSLFDALVLSRLDQMQLRYLGPARAELDNATSTLLPVSGATTADIALDADIPPKYVAVCIGSGAHLAGYHMQTDHLDILAEGLLHIPSELGIRILLSSSAPKNIRYAIERHLIRKLQHTGGVNAEVIDYSAPSTRQLPPPTHVIAAASHVIVTPDDIASMSLAVSLQKPTYIAGEESTKHILRNYYRLLDTSNLVRRFYPKGSRHSYMLIPDISGEIDEFSAIRDHEPWAKYDAHADLQRAVSFTQARFHALVNHPSPS